jgi:hypothetical protein
VRKLLLSAVIAFLAAGSSLQIIAGLLVAVAFHLLHAICNPFIDRWYGWLQHGFLAIIWLSLLVGLVLKLNQLDTTKDANGDSSQNDVAGALVLTLYIAILVIALWIISMKVKYHLRARKTKHEAFVKQSQVDAKKSALDAAMLSPKNPHAVASMATPKGHHARGGTGLVKGSVDQGQSMEWFAKAAHPSLGQAADFAGMNVLASLRTREGHPSSSDLKSVLGSLKGSPMNGGSHATTATAGHAKNVPSDSTLWLGVGLHGSPPGPTTNDGAPLRTLDHTALQILPENDEDPLGDAKDAIVVPPAKKRSPPPNALASPSEDGGTLPGSAANDFPEDSDSSDSDDSDEDGTGGRFAHASAAAMLDAKLAARIASGGRLGSPDGHRSRKKSSGAAQTITEEASHLPSDQVHSNQEHSISRQMAELNGLNEDGNSDQEDGDHEHDHHDGEEGSHGGGRAQRLKSISRQMFALMNDGHTPAHGEEEPSTYGSPSFHRSSTLNRYHLERAALFDAEVKRRVEKKLRKALKKQQMQQQQEQGGPATTRATDEQAAALASATGGAGQPDFQTAREAAMKEMTASQIVLPYPASYWSSQFAAPSAALPASRGAVPVYGRSFGHVTTGTHPVGKTAIAATKPPRGAISAYHQQPQKSVTSAGSTRPPATPLPAVPQGFFTTSTVGGKHATAMSFNALDPSQARFVFLPGPSAVPGHAPMSPRHGTRGSVLRPASRGDTMSPTRGRPSMIAVDRRPSRLEMGSPGAGKRGSLVGGEVGSPRSGRPRTISHDDDAPLSARTTMSPDGRSRQAVLSPSAVDASVPTSGFHPTALPPNPIRSPSGGAVGSGVEDPQIEVIDASRPAAASGAAALTSASASPQPGEAPRSLTASPGAPVHPSSASTFLSSSAQPGVHSLTQNSEDQESDEEEGEEFDDDADLEEFMTPNEHILRKK